MVNETSAPWMTQQYAFGIDGSILDPVRVHQRLERLSGIPKEVRDGDFRLPAEVDRDRVLYSPYFKRLAGVSQIVSPTLRGKTSHTRLMHSLKVSNVAREIASDLCRLARHRAEGRRDKSDDSIARRIAYFGGLDIAACEVAGLAHDIGHAPFGHASEKAIKNWIVEHDPASDGFEGNPQTVRILTRLDRRKMSDTEHSLDLTKVVLRAVIKYPWLRDLDADQNDLKFYKYATYQSDKRVLVDTECAVSEFIVENELMSVEACIMDMADDITYAMHDLHDFYELGLIDFVSIERELSDALTVLNKSGFLGLNTYPLQNKFAETAVKLDETVFKFDRDYYMTALVDVQTWIHDHPILWERFDNSQVKSASIRRVVSQKIKEILSGLRISDDLEEATRHQVIHLEPPEWHQLQVMKAIAIHSVIASPAVALHEQAQVAALHRVLTALEDICLSRDLQSIPHPLQEFVSEIPVENRSGSLLRIAIADYVCGLTDQNCVEIARYVQGIEIPEVGQFSL